MQARSFGRLMAHKVMRDNLLLLLSVSVPAAHRCLSPKYSTSQHDHGSWMRSRLQKDSNGRCDVIKERFISHEGFTFHFEQEAAQDQVQPHEVMLSNERPNLA